MELDGLENPDGMLAVVYEVGRTLVGSLELDELLSRTAASLQRHFDADVYVMLPEPNGQKLVARGVAGSHPELLGATVPIEPHDQSLGAWVYRRSETAVVEDADQDPRTWVVRKLTGGRAYLAVPMVSHGVPVGALLLIETRRTRAFKPDEQKRCLAIASQLAVAVENARLYEDLRRSYAELARTQSQLVQRERLAALGELAAVMAHEIRNPLAVIFNAIAAVRPAVAKTASALQMIDIIAEEAERLNGIVGDLLEFARPSKQSLAQEDLAALIENALQAAMLSAPQKVTVRRELETVPPMQLDARLIRQALLNLLQNALQAMEAGGTLTVRLAHLAERGRMRIEVRDTGTGISPLVLPRVFEPFFTTRAKGTGLGLQLVKRIVERHSGTIGISSEQGVGTAVSIELPVDPDAPVRRGDAEPTQPRF